VKHPQLNGHSCVVRTATREVFTSDERGIRPPLLWLRENPAVLKDAAVSDKIIGRAAALLFAHGGVCSIWAECMSDAAIDFLSGTAIIFEYATRVEAILMRDGSDICPMERRAADIDDPAAAFRVFDEVIPC